MTTTAPTKPPPRPDEELKRMSFGDHLDELRRRLLISFAAVFVAVFAVLPFKSEVTAIYIKPYRQMWDMAFAIHLDEWRFKGIPDAVPEAERRPWSGIENLEDRLDRETAEFLRDHHERIIDGSFPAEHQRKIETRGGFVLPYSLKAIGGLEDFWTFMAATFLFGLILALPIVMYQAWAFIAAGLYSHERRVVLRYFPFALGLLVAGVLFGYFLVVPFGLFFLVKMMNWAQVEMFLSVAQYFSFLLTLTAALAVVFQLPLIMLALQKVGLVSYAAMRKNWRFVVLGMFAVSAILTPPDPFTQVLMACPMVVLFGLGLLLMHRADRRAAAVAGASP